VAKGFLDGYKSYDTTQGYGSSRQWRAAFSDRMGIGEARERVGTGSPEEILGVARGSTWSVVRAAYKKLAFECHPDRALQNGLTVEEATERFKRVVAAYTILEARRK